MIQWFAAHYWATGIVTFLLMWSDWLLTILQERERSLHYAEHYFRWDAMSRSLLSSSCSRHFLPLHLS